MPSPEDRTLSRRALFGGGPLRASRRRFDEQWAEPASPPLPPWAAGDWASLTLRSADAVAPLLATLALRPGRRVLDLGGAENPFGSAAAAAGAVVERSEPTARRLGPQAARPERWGSYEGLLLALDRFPGFATEEHTLRWRFPGLDALWDAVSVPLDAAQQPDAEARLAQFCTEVEGGLELRVEVIVASATLSA